MMSASLKGYIPGLGRLLGLSPAALYERQRSLVREGLLAAESGRGPGSGVRATAPAVALLVLSVLATDRLSESDPRVRALASAGPASGERCPFTGCKSFLDAFTKVLSMTGKAPAVREIVVSRTADRVAIRYWNDAGEEKISQFAGQAPIESGLIVTATLSHNLLQHIAADVKAMLNAIFEEGSPA
jgi:hypothetical protein